MPRALLPLLLLVTSLGWAQDGLESLTEDELRKRIAVDLDHKRTEPALAAAEQWTRVAPRNPDAWAMCGRLQTELGRLEPAEAALSRVLAMDPGRARIWAERGALRLRLERPAEALEDAGQALGVSPDLALAHFVAGLAHAAQGEHAEALEAYDRAIGASPPYPKAVYARGQARKALGDAEAAEADFAAALELDKEAALPWGQPPAPTLREGQADLSHVVVGQRYVYVMPNNMQSVWEVREVGENAVIYDTSILMDMGDGPQPVGEPMRQEWRFTPPAKGAPAANAGGPEVDLSRETLTISGIQFDCLVLSTEHGKSWVSMNKGSDSVYTFPGAIRVVGADGQQTMVLTEVITPKAPQRR